MKKSQTTQNKRRVQRAVLFFRKRGETWGYMKQKVAGGWKKKTRSKMKEEAGRSGSRAEQNPERHT